MLPKSVVLINNSALSGCTQLNNIIFDTALTAVGAQALNTVASSLTAKNTNATYRLGSPADAFSSPNERYHMGIMLTGEISDYQEDNVIDTDKVASEISSTMTKLLA